MNVTVASVIEATQDDGPKGQHVASYSVEKEGIRRVYVQIYIPDDHPAYGTISVGQELTVAPALVPPSTPEG